MQFHLLHYSRSLSCFHWKPSWTFLPTRAPGPLVTSLRRTLLHVMDTGYLLTDGFVTTILTTYLCCLWKSRVWNPREVNPCTRSPHSFWNNSPAFWHIETNERKYNNNHINTQFLNIQQWVWNNCSSQTESNRIILCNTNNWQEV